MQSPNRFYYTWRLLFLHHSFAWCFFFYLSFLFPPVEPGVFNCCVTTKGGALKTVLRFLLFVFHPPQNIIKKFYTVSVSAFSFYLKKKTPAKEKQTRGSTPRPRQRRTSVHSLRFSVGCSAHSPANAPELERVRARAPCCASRPLALLN